MSTADIQSDSMQHQASRRLAAEDIVVGSFITVTAAVSELASFLWFGETAEHERSRPVRYHFTPNESGTPFKVLAVCLPFVFVEDLEKSARTLDLRRCDVCQLSTEYVDVVRNRRKLSFKKQLKKIQRQHRRKKRK